MVKMFIVTVGVQYGHLPDDDQHPLGIHGDEYMVIEAPEEEIARAIASAVMNREWAFIYEYGVAYDDAQLERYHPGGEKLRIAWIDDPEALGAMERGDVEMKYAPLRAVPPSRGGD